MLDYNILKAKPYIEIPSNIEGGKTVRIKDLASNVITRESHMLQDCNIVKVTKDYIARPDLVSLAIYGTDQYADIICKYNGLSNPFELNEDMILIIPDLMSVQNTVVNGNPSVVNETGANIASKNKKNNQKQRNIRRNPSEQTVGESNYIIDKTNKLVYY